MNTSKLLLTGAVLGLVAGLLIAPKKGTELRSDIADTTDKWTHKFKSMLGRTGAELEELKEVLSNEVEGLSNDMRKRILKIISETANAAHNGRKMANA